MIAFCLYITHQFGHAELVDLSQGEIAHIDWFESKSTELEAMALVRDLLLDFAQPVYLLLGEYLHVPRLGTMPIVRVEIRLVAKLIGIKSRGI